MNSLIRVWVESGELGSQRFCCLKFLCQGEKKGYTDPCWWDKSELTYATLKTGQKSKEGNEALLWFLFLTYKSNGAKTLLISLEQFFSSRRKFFSLHYCCSSWFMYNGRNIKFVWVKLVLWAFPDSWIFPIWSLLGDLSQYIEISALLECVRLLYHFLG